VLNAVKRIIRNLMRLLMSAHPTVLVLECFKQMERRFEQIDKRFEVMTMRIDRFMAWSFATTLTAGGIVIAAVKSALNLKTFLT
jgi:hypothetical protein